MSNETMLMTMNLPGRLAIALLFGISLMGLQARAQDGQLTWREATELPDGSGGEGQARNLGVAGPFIGISRDRRDNLPEGAVREVLIVAGGANFPIPAGHRLWDPETYKRYYDTVWALSREASSDGFTYSWIDTNATLETPRAYGAAVSTDLGLLCVGGVDEPRDAEGGIIVDEQGDALAAPVFDEAFLLRWDAAKGRVTRVQLPPLPIPSVYGSAAIVGDKAYIIVGQTGLGLDSATDRVFTLDLGRLSFDGGGSLVIAEVLDKQGRDRPLWQEIEPIPGGARAYAMSVAQHNGFHQCLYVFGGRRNATDADDPSGVFPVSLDAADQWYLYRDTWEYNPEGGANPWRRRAAIKIDGRPAGLTAGSAVAVGQSHIMVVAGSTGENIRDAFSERQVGWADYYDDQGVSRHVGMSRAILSYHTITDTWATLGQAPTMDDPESGVARQVAANAVTTQAVRWGDEIILATGEVRPKVRSPKVWSLSLSPKPRTFGFVNYSVLVLYLLAMVAIGFWFMRRNQNTDDFFRGGQHIPWWAAGCSIFATMLSSLTFTGLPAKAFAQDWTYFLGSMMIITVAPIAVFVALPFFRRIDATSAYEYLELRFNRPVRLFGSASFTLFHLFRMAVVMSLTGLALSAATPLTPTYSVLIMGILCIVYCSLGGIEAVIWTDTIQTVVLLGGGLLAFIMLVLGAGSEGMGAAVDADKLKLANFNLDITSAQIAIWVIIIGGIGQNISSYTADHAVVQRYLTTSNQQQAARSIWTNAALVLPASLLFFGLGTALFAYYHQNPGQLDPTSSTDQVFPLYIATQMPVGIAGLIIAGIFAAAQSTVSTSMNSTATTIVTDFMRPFNACKTEKGYLRAARLLTVAIGVLGTLIGLVFIDPEIKSLFDSFLKVIGLFMGVLGGLFVLGVMTRRANGPGALVGGLLGAGSTFYLWQFTDVNGYIYTSTGIVACFVTGLLASIVIPTKSKNLSGLTIFTMKSGDDHSV